MNEWNEFQTELGEWSDETFGYTATRGPSPVIAHLKKEVQELAEDPSNVSEYADCMILLLDAARRIGISAAFLLNQCIVKLEINRRRKWGEPDKDGVIEHIKEKKMKVKLAKKDTPMAKFQKERTNAISEMFDNVDDLGIYPTGTFFARIDRAATLLILEVEDNNGKERD